MNKIAKCADILTWICMTLALVSSIFSAVGGETPSWTLVFLLYIFCFLSYFAYNIVKRENKE